MSVDDEIDLDRNFALLSGFVFLMCPGHLEARW